MSIESLKANIRVIPDYPAKGIQFQDITTLMKNAECLKELEDRLYELYKDKGITKVVGLESRGFILGAALAVRLGAGFVLARKMGKLPAESIRQTYDLEYGHDTIEMHVGSLEPDDVVLIHDDLLATGGTMNAAIKLVGKFGIGKPYVNFLIELTDLKGRQTFPEGVEVTSIIEV